jgi:hypothetical protein
MRRNVRSALVVAASAVVALGPLTGVANAKTTAPQTTPPQPTAAYQGGAVVSNGETATVRVAYTCTTSAAAPFSHLYVAVKQGPGVSPENTSTESGDVKAYLSSNWSVDRGPNALVCDGKRHLQKIEVKQEEGFGPLTTGTALVQICVFDNIVSLDPTAEPTGGFAMSYTMEKVVVTHAPSK